MPNDVANLVKSLVPDDSVGILFGCGSNDDFHLYPGIVALQDTLDLLGLPYEFFSHNGNHIMPASFKQRALIFLDSLMGPPVFFTGLENKVSPAHLMNPFVYPNPFSASTTFEYELKENAIVSLTIFNHLGQGVGMLVSEKQSEGQQRIQWNAEGLPPGIYFYRISQTGNQSLTIGKIVKY
jgi:hypothetical protein